MLITTGSIKGSPGATSTALALAAAWPRPVVVLEADPSGGDLALRCESAAGGPPSPSPSLLTLGAAVRGGVGAGFSLLVEQSVRLESGVNLIQGGTSPAQARGLRELWSSITQVCRTAREDVIVDVGRMDPDNPALEIARAADAVLVAAGRSMESVLHLRDGLSDVLRSVTVPGRATSVVPVIVGPDSHAERDRADLDQVLGTAGLPVTAALSLAYDPRALSRLEAGDSGKRLARTVLMRSAARVSGLLAGPVVEEPVQTGAGA